MQNKTILFIINGLGLGNSTRCSAVIQILIERNFTVDVLTSGNGLAYFEKFNDIRNTYSYESLYYGKTKGKLSIYKTLLIIPKLLFLYLINCIRLHKILNRNNYDAIVFDSDYTVASLIFKRTRPRLISINNAEIIIRECKNMPGIPQSIRLQYIIEKMDRCFHKLVPNINICPDVREKILTSTIKTKYTNPIVRKFSAKNPQKPSPKNILIMLSGSQFGSEIDFLKKLEVEDEILISVVGKDGHSNNKVRFFGKLFDNRELLQAADLLVINAGFSAISEAITLKIPSVVIPIENHAEQYVNAMLIEKNGLGLIANENNAHEKILELIKNFKKFVEAHHNLNSNNQGANQAANEIEMCLTTIKVS